MRQWRDVVITVCAVLLTSTSGRAQTHVSGLFSMVGRNADAVDASNHTNAGYSPFDATYGRIFFDAAAALYPSGNERRARNYTRPMSRPGELAQAWRTGGLINVQDTMLTIRMDFASFDDYWAPYEGKDGPGPEYLATLDAGQRQRLREVVRAAYLDGDPDGPRSYAATAWAVKGTVPI